MKKLLIVLAVLIGLPLIALGVAAAMIDPIVKNGTEKLASEALKVPVTLEKATVKYSGSLTLDGLAIANPEGYQESQACAFERFDAALDVGSLFGDVVEVKHVTVIKPVLTIEFAGTKSNWSTLMDNLSRGEKAPGDRKPGPETEKGAEKKFRIGKILVQEATVRFRSDLIAKEGASYTLPSIELDNIGTADDAATMAEVLALLMESLVAEAMKAGASSLPKQLVDSLNAEIRNAGDVFKGLLRSGKEQIRKAPAETLKKTGESLKEKGKELKKGVEGLKDIFKKKD